MATKRCVSNSHASYLAAVSALSALKDLAKDDRKTLEPVAAIVAHLVAYPYCVQCGPSGNLREEEIALHDALIAIMSEVPGPTVCVEGSDGSDEYVARGAFRYIAGFLSGRRLNQCGKSLRQTTAKMSNQGERGIG